MSEVDAVENKEFIQFLKTTLIKIENVINLMNQDVPKHIPAYNKMLGVQQKLGALSQERKGQMFSQLIITRSVINYFMNGRYGDGFKRVLELKKELIAICFRIEQSERDKDK